MKKTILFACIPLSCILFGQVGINTATPTATLEVTAKNSTGTTTNVDGMLIPRINLQRAELMSAVPTSTLIYVNDLSVGTATGIASDITSTGFYYFDSTKWVAVITSNNNNDWHLTGNTGTNQTNNFIGTSDNQNVNFRRNNVASGFLGTFSTSFGVGSMPQTSPALFSTAFGAGTLPSSTGIGGSAFGYQALRANTTGIQNTAIGYGALTANTGGGNNVAIGHNSLSTLNLSANGSYNVAIGTSSLTSLTSGISNVAIGDAAGIPNGGGVPLTSGNGNILIGRNTTVASSTGDNQMNIGNAIFGVNLGSNITALTANVGIGTSAPTTRLHVVATTANASRYNLFDATAGTNEYGILTLRNTSPLATGNYSLLGFNNNGPTSGGANWALGSIRTGATSTTGSEEDFYLANSTGGALTERLRIKPDTGFVGIGTSTPTARVEIASGAAGTSGLKFTNINNTTATTQNAAALGVDATGNVVVQNTAPLTTTFKSFNINASSAANSLITIGSLEFRYPTTTCTTTPTFIQVRSTSGANNLGVQHAMFLTAQNASSFVNTTPLTVTSTFADIASLPLNCVQDSHAQFNFFSYTDRTFYRVNVNIADGDSLGFGALGYIFVELQR